ncbi:MAG: type secretion system domain protein, partial [Planctomycetaceae bacterium]|nr:type secretion system domain protein [Planctomycetaceae bacterium]
SKIPAVDARQALYSLELRTADRSRTVQLGTAWAVAPRRLVTTGDAARGIALNQEFFPHAYARHTLSGAEFEITRMTLHPQYESAIGKADQAIREINRLLPELEKIKDANDRKEAEDLLRKLDSEAIVAAEESVNVNIAVLDISKDSPASLSWEQSLPIKVGQQMTLIGHALSRTDALVDPDHPKLLEQHVGRLQHAEPVPNPAVPARCLVKFDGILKDQNWSGSPVLSANGAVIGVYVRPTPPPPGVEGVPITTHDVTVINGVRDWLPKTVQATAIAPTL